MPQFRSTFMSKIFRVVFISSILIAYLSTVQSTMLHAQEPDQCAVQDGGFGVVAHLGWAFFYTPEDIDTALDGQPFDSRSGQGAGGRAARAGARQRAAGPAEEAFVPGGHVLANAHGCSPCTVREARTGPPAAASTNPAAPWHTRHLSAVPAMQ